MLSSDYLLTIMSLLNNFFKLIMNKIGIHIFNNIHYYYFREIIFIKIIIALFIYQRNIFTQILFKLFIIFFLNKLLLFFYNKFSFYKGSFFKFFLKLLAYYLTIQDSLTLIRNSFFILNFLIFFFFIVFRYTLPFLYLLSSI